jgi:hypothetical protein
MDRTQQHRITLKFIEEMELDDDHHAATLIDLIAGHRKSNNPVADLRKASFYLLRLLERYEEDEQSDVGTDPNGSPTRTKVLRLYDTL